LCCERVEPALTMVNHEDRVGQDYISIRLVFLALGALGSNIYKRVMYYIICKIPIKGFYLVRIIKSIKRFFSMINLKLKL